MVTNDRAALAVSTSGPVTAGRIFRSWHRGAVVLCPSEHVVLVGCISSPIDHRALFVERSLFGDVVFAPLYLSRFARHLNAFGVGPWARANAVLGINSTRPLRRKIGVPGLAARPGGRCETLAMPVSTGETAKVTTIAEADAGNEKAHGILLCR